MSGRAKRHRPRSQLLLVGLALVLGSTVMWAAPAAAHDFTRNDGNDSPSKIDLRSVSVSHTSTGVVHKVTTHNAWTPSSLQNDSFFVIGIDKDHDPSRYERCAFIYFAARRLRGELSNCRSGFIQFLPVAKLTGRTAKITIPKSQTGSVYWWYGASFWVGAAPCRNVCVDFAPNTLPDVLHDMIRPLVDMETIPFLRVWEDSTTPEFVLPFFVSDDHAGIQSWTVQRRAVDSAIWSDVVSGSAAGSKEPPIVGEEGTRFDYRVVAADKQGNTKTGPIRRVYIPTDDDDLAGFSDPPVVAADATAFGGSFSQMSSGTFTYSWTPGSDCRFELIGSRTGDWTVEVSADGGPPTTINGIVGVDLPRSTLYSDVSCATTYVVTVISGTFGLDAVLG